MFVVDNDSPDDTVARATRAGAEHVLTYRTERFEERYRFGLMNEFVRHASTISEHDHVWWLWLDADEFPRPQDRHTLREMLEPLHQRFRVVGARVLNHYPTPGERAFRPGLHPAASQLLVEEATQNICRLRHRKHPLQRWDRSGPALTAGLGFHRAECEMRPLYEPVTPIVLHHVPFREERDTRARLEALWAGSGQAQGRAIEGDLAVDHMKARMESVDAVYAGDWARVHNFLPDRPERGVAPVDWRSLRPALATDLPSW